MEDPLQDPLQDQVPASLTTCRAFCFVRESTPRENSGLMVWNLQPLKLSQVKQSDLFYETPAKKEMSHVFIVENPFTRRFL
jgi:hypothetical protein